MGPFSLCVSITEHFNMMEITHLIRVIVYRKCRLGGWQRWIQHFQLGRRLPTRVLGRKFVFQKCQVTGLFWGSTALAALDLPMVEDTKSISFTQTISRVSMCIHGCQTNVTFGRRNNRLRAVSLIIIVSHALAVVFKMSCLRRIFRFQDSCSSLPSFWKPFSGSGESSERKS